MTLTLSTLSTTWRLYDDFKNDQSFYCDVFVEIEHNRYIDNREFYYISYKFSSSDGLDNKCSINPLNSDYQDMEIVAVNEMTTVLCKYLLMSMDELKQFSGSVTVNCYKKSIMSMISHLWD